MKLSPVGRGGAASAVPAPEAASLCSGGKHEPSSGSCQPRATLYAIFALGRQATGGAPAQSPTHQEEHPFHGPWGVV